MSNTDRNPADNAKHANPRKRSCFAPDWGPRFLAALRETANIRMSAELACVGRATVYTRRNSDPDFAREMSEAIEDAVDALKLEVRRRALNGIDEPVIYKGQIMGSWINEQGKQVLPNTPGSSFVPLTVKKYSDVLMMFLLKAHKPGEFRDNVRIEHTGSDGGDINVKHNGMTAEQFSALSQEEKMRVLRERNANWMVDRN
jgi:hypothetical protein